MFICVWVSVCESVDMPFNFIHSIHLVLLILLVQQLTYTYNRNLLQICQKFTVVVMT